MIGAIRETSKEKIYHELGFEYPESRIWYRKLYCFQKVFKTESPSYLFDVVLTDKRAYITRSDDKLPHFIIKHYYFKNPFFPSSAIVLSKLDLNIRNSESLTSFKGNILEFIRPSKNSVFRFNNTKGIKLLTK